MFAISNTIVLLAPFAPAHLTDAAAAWIGWNEGLVTLRSIAASLRLRSEGHVSGMIRTCEREFSTDRTLLDQLDGALAALRA